MYHWCLYSKMETTNKVQTPTNIWGTHFLLPPYTLIYCISYHIISYHIIIFYGATPPVLNCGASVRSRLFFPLLLLSITATFLSSTTLQRPVSGSLKVSSRTTNFYDEDFIIIIIYLFNQ